MDKIKEILTSDACTRFLWNCLYFGIAEVVIILGGYDQYWAVLLGAFLNGASKEIRKEYID